MARARVDRTHPINVLAEIERLTDVDRQVLRLVAEHEALSSEQLAALCFDRPGRVADAEVRLRYLATRALLVGFEHPGTHPAGFPADDLSHCSPAVLPRPVPARWGDGRRWAWSLGQGGAYWAGVEHVLSRDSWLEAWSRSFVPHERPHVRRRLALNDLFAVLDYTARDRADPGLDQWWGPARCAETSGGKTTPDAHGRWRWAGKSVPFWVYCDSVRRPARTLIDTVHRHRQVHAATADRDAILLVMVNDNREQNLHRRWTPPAAGGVLPPVSTTSWRRLRSWAAEAIWWPLSAPTAQGVRLHQLADVGRALDPRFANPGRHPSGGLP